MKTFIAVLTLVVLSLALAAAPSGAAQKRTISFNDVVVKTSVVEGSTFAGLIRGGPLGRGAVTNTSKPAGEGRFASTGRVFYGAGTLKVVFTNTLTPQPDGSIAFAGQGRITGGTHRYRRARGTFTFTGTRPANDPVITLNFEGSMTY